MAVISESRTRTRDEPVIKDEIVMTCTLGCTSNGPSGKFFTISRLSESIQDVVTKDYKKLIAQGAIINNPCVYTKSTRTSSGSGTQYVNKITGTEKYQLDGPISQWAAEYFNNPVLWTGSTLPDNNEARCKLSALAYIDSTEYAFGEDALELKETIKFLKNPLSSLLGVSRSFEKRKRRVAKQKPVDKIKAITDLYLQYQFAASPLVRSCMDILGVYSTTAKVYPTRLSARGKLVEEVLIDTPVTNNGFHYDRYYLQSWESKASILYEVSNPVYDWRYRLGFRGKDWPTTIWQIMPLSFMVDRLLDVSSFTKGVINLADPKVKILAASYRTKHLVHKKYKYASRDSNGTADFIIHGNEVEDIDFAYNRQPWVPSIIDTVPKFTPGYLVEDATKIADLVALIISNFTFTK